LSLGFIVSSVDLVSFLLGFVLLGQVGGQILIGSDIRFALGEQ
jgi:hypothetical protein